MSAVCLHLNIPVAIVEGQGCGEAGGRDSQLDGLGDDLAPGCLRVVDRLPEEVVEQEVVQLGVLVIGGLDVAQEHAPDDAAAPPHQGDSAIVQLPVEHLGRLPQQHEPLGVGDDLGRVQGLPDVLNKSLQNQNFIKI